MKEKKNKKSILKVGLWRLKSQTNRLKQIFKQKSSVWNSAESAIFRISFDVLLLTTEFQTELQPALAQGQYAYDPVSY